MESRAQVRAAVISLVIGVVVIVIGVLSAGGDNSSTQTSSLGWPVFLGVFLLVFGAVFLVIGLRNKRQEERELQSLRAKETRDNSDDRPL
jgi:uncharacterized membrane protein HdeD (DUF308 family)